MDPNRETRLLDLWKRRPTLDRAEAGELFNIVKKLLSEACRRPKTKSFLNALPFEPEDYISDFFEYKVYHSPGNDELEHEGVVSHYFNNYLVSRLRRERVPTVGGMGGEEESTDFPPVVDTKDAFGKAGCNEIDPATIFLDTLRTPESVAESARAFLTNCPTWARLFLRRHDCADKDDNKMSRDALAEEFDIPSYAHKAYKLGVVIPGNRRRDGCVEYDYYATTMLGRWMEEDLGIEIHQENLPLVHACLKMLCQTALTDINGQGDLV